MSGQQPDGMPSMWQRRKLIRDAHLTATEKCLLYTLDDYAGNDGQAFPTQQTLARNCSLHVNSVKRLLRELRRHEVLTVVRRASGNQYRIQWQELKRQAEADCSVTNEQKTGSTGAPSAGSAGEPFSAKTGSAGAPYNKHGFNYSKEPCGHGLLTKRKSGKSTGWNGGAIDDCEFQTETRAAAFHRLTEAITRGWLADTPADELWFLSLWANCVRRFAAGTIRCPGAVLTQALKTNARTKPAEGDEDTAADWLRQRRRQTRQPQKTEESPLADLANLLKIKDNTDAA